MWRCERRWQNLRPGNQWERMIARVARRRQVRRVEGSGLLLEDHGAGVRVADTFVVVKAAPSASFTWPSATCCVRLRWHSPICHRNLVWLVRFVNEILAAV